MLEEETDTEEVMDHQDKGTAVTFLTKIKAVIISTSMTRSDA